MQRGRLAGLERIGSTEGDMRALIDRRFRCSVCDSMFVALWLFAKRAEAEAWEG